MAEIKKVKNFPHIDIHPSLKDKLKAVQSILQSEKYHELFIAEKDGNAIALALSWLNSFHPSAKYIRFFAGKEQDRNVYIYELLTPAAPMKKITLPSLKKKDFIYSGGRLKKQLE